MILQIFLSILIGLLPLVMLVILFAVKIKSGRSLVKAKSLYAILFLVIGLICFIGCIYILCFKIIEGHIFYAMSLFLMSACFTSYAVTRRNCITENGIIILDSFAHLIKWNEIQEFGVLDNRIYLKSGEGYVSIAFSNKNIKDIEKIISENVQIKRRTYYDK